MRLLLNFLLGILIAGLLVIAADAWSAETIQTCTQADGSIVYTNKDVAGCAAVKLPELSIVPSLDKMPVYTGAPTPIPSFIYSTPTNSVLAETCMLYSEWLMIQQATLGGTSFHTIEDNRRFNTLSKLFVGFIPVGCQ